ncbi:MAG: DNA alkylation repair protein [Candidatus Freyrarchaeum guaymaensis]
MHGVPDARLAVSDKKAQDKEFERFFPIIEREADDCRIYVKKGVNWMLRQIGKRNLNLNKKAIKIAEEIKQLDSKSAHRIASDALRELTSEKIKKDYKNKNPKSSINPNFSYIL